MKKVFVGISAAALAAVMCVAFVGCGEGADAQSITSETVTAEQWDAAFAALEKDDAKYTIDAKSEFVITVTANQTENGEKKIVGTITTTQPGIFINNGAKQFSKTESATFSVDGDFTPEEIEEYLGGDPDELANKPEEEAYAERDASGVSTIYTKDRDGKWETIHYQGHLNPIVGNMPIPDFDGVKYDEALKGYVEKDHETGEEFYIVFKFNKSGQLAAIFIHEGDGKAEDKGDVSVLSYLEVSYVISYTAKDFSLPTVEA